MRFISSLSVSSLMLVACLAATGCSSGSGASSDPGADGGGGGGGGTDPIVGKSCNTDGDCGSAYTCEGAKPGTPGGSCTPDRACSTTECNDICLGLGQFDPATGAATKACSDDCLANAKCCSGSGSGGTTPGTPGKCAKKAGTTPPPSDSGTTPPPADTGPTTTPMSWPGTWSVTVEYDVGCDVGFGTIKRGHNKHTLSMAISGSASSLSAEPKTPTSGWTPMSGSGDDGAMTLSGEFPFEDETATVVGSSENATTIKINSVTSAKAASGTFEGQGKGQFGAKCTISAGTITMAR